MGRILGLDYGSKTVGVAVTDPLRLTAGPVDTLCRKEENKLRRTLAAIEAYVRQYEVDRIVLGFPLNMDGSMSERAEKTLLFRDMLVKRTGLPVILQNEQLTTVEADEVLREMGVPRAERKNYIDRIAAAVILKDYLGSERKRSDVGTDCV
ncbi:MAG: Holliday junction resolvase RuvX [Lachnospiraceae bacterium]|nr:Holliday junction resolvase RuvX [Lachnospiraceae bacterium]MBP5254787.1 Holliday junction resolvase RuvX [Lachnospiraceae bacterium]